MTRAPAQLRSLSAPERSSLIAEAADALRRGLLVLIPTETVYGIAASAASEEALARLAKATGARAGPSAWHAPSTEAARDALDLSAPLHRRLLARLTPGPVTFLVQKPADDLQRIRSRLGAVPGSIDDGREISVRVPDHPIAQQLAAQAGLPLVAHGLPGGPAEAQRRDDIALVLDDGPPRLGKPSTTIRLLASGGYEIARPGVLEERFIRRQLDRTILFVCTGNTCRSPMAETIAKALFAGRGKAQGQSAGGGAARGGTGGGAFSTRIRSAGTGASQGAPVSPETIDAVRALNLNGAEPLLRDLTGHRASELTRQMIAEAEAIYAMTPAHARIVLAIDPTAAGKVHTLDPGGGDIPDPIGGPQEVYTRTAERLRDLIQKRLDELD